MTNKEQLHTDLKKCLEVLEAGGVILYPTDTIWGIGCDATNTEAVEKVNKLKKRDASKPMLMLLDRPPKLQTYVKEIPEMAWDLIEVSDKPVSIIYDGGRNVSPLLISKEGTVGIRITEEKFTQNLVGRFKRPIVSTSANIAGKVAPSCFLDVANEILDGVDYVVNYRQDEPKNPSVSSIIRLTVSNQISIIRK